MGSSGGEDKYKQRKFFIDDTTENAIRKEISKWRNLKYVYLVWYIRHH